MTKVTASEDLMPFSSVEKAIVQTLTGSAIGTTGMLASDF
jgi:hypothetical protein